jgi:hypothetical protein
MFFYKASLYITFGALVLFSFSCKKAETDELGPVVLFNTPTENQPFNVYDNISINATISDETAITFVSVSLVNAQYIPVLSAVALPVSSPSMTINKQLYIDNIQITTGTYHLLVTASDGVNESRSYQKIHIIEAPRVLKSIFVISSSSTATTSYSTIDSEFTSLTPYHTFSGDYLASAVSNYSQQVYRCGNYTGAFEAMDLEFNTTKFSVPAFASTSPYFTAFYSNETTCYVARYDGAILGYDNAGVVVYNSMSVPGYYVASMSYCGNQMVTVEKDKLAPISKLITYYPTGVPEKECLISQDVVAFCEKDINNLFVFGNVNGQGVIQLFDKINNNLWNPYPYALPTGTISSAVKIDENTYLLSHSNGTIYKYNYSTASVTAYLSGYTAVKLKFDALNNHLIVAEANTIHAFNYATGSIVHSVPVSETVLGVELLYNR